MRSLTTNSRDTTHELGASEMLQVYRYHDLPSEYESITEADDQCRQQLDQLKRGVRSLSGWTPPRVQFALVESPTVPGDFPCLYRRLPVFSQRAWDALRPLIQSAVEALPIIHPSGKPHYIINLLDVVDCLDLPHCVTNKDPFDPRDRITQIFRYAFREEVIQGRHIFTAPEMINLDVYVSPDFKRVVEENH